MATCVNFVSSGSGSSQTISLEVVTPQPATFSACTYVLPSGSEISNSPFSLSVADASAIGFAIVGLWAIAFGFRALISSLRDDSRIDTQD